MLLPNFKLKNFDISALVNNIYDKTVDVFNQII